MENTQENKSKIPSPMYERNTKGPILYIRHGQTHFNKWGIDYHSELGAMEKLEFLDCPLNSHGQQQASDLAPKVKEIKVYSIYCSPMHRCLETCYLSLKDHPEKDKFRIIVHPLITETVHCNHDYSKRICEKKKQFNKENCGLNFDWSLFESMHPDENSQELYFTEFMDNLPEDDGQYAKKALEKIKNEKNHDELDKMLVEFGLYCANKDRWPESLTHIFKRSVKFKEHLKDSVLKDLKEEEGKVLVYTHSGFCQISTSESAFEMETIESFPKDSYKPENCEIITIHLN